MVGAGKGAILPLGREFFPPRKPHRNQSAVITQIYEIQSSEEVEPLCNMGVDHIGSVILSPEDWRQPAIRQTVAAVQDLGKKSTLIPLFNDPETVYRTLDYYRPDIVHFCDLLSLAGEGQARCERCVALQEAIRRRYPDMAIMRSIPIGRPGEHRGVDTLALASLFRTVSDYFLTDTLLSTGTATASQPVDGFVGITGQTCHWTTARELVASSDTPVILAGGLSPDNVAEAIHAVRPAGVDSCTLTNQRGGQGRPVRFRKDMARVRRFVDEAARAAAENLTKAKASA